MAALAAGLACLGMAGWHAAGLRTAGAVGRNQPPDDPFRLAAPDAVLLAGPDREGHAGVPHRAGLADGDGLRLELRRVGEERVVVGRDDLKAGGLITPAPDLGHAA